MALSMRLFGGTKRVMFKGAFALHDDTPKTTDAVLELVRGFVLRDHEHFDKSQIARREGAFDGRPGGAVRADNIQLQNGLDYVSLVRVVVENEAYLVQVGTSAIDTRQACRQFCARAHVDFCSNTITFENAYFEPDRSPRTADPDIVLTSARALMSVDTDLVSPRSEGAGDLTIPELPVIEAHDPLDVMMHVVETQIALSRSNERANAAAAAAGFAQRDARICELEQQVESLRNDHRIIAHRLNTFLQQLEL